MIGAHVTHLSLYFKVWGQKQRNFPNSLTLCKQFLACELCVMNLYITLFFTRQRHWTLSKGFVRDWNSGGYSQKYDTLCKYGL